MFVLITRCQLFERGSECACHAIFTASFASTIWLRTTWIKSIYLFGFRLKCWYYQRKSYRKTLSPNDVCIYLVRRLVPTFAERVCFFMIFDQFAFHTSLSSIRGHVVISQLKQFLIKKKSGEKGNTVDLTKVPKNPHLFSLFKCDPLHICDNGKFLLNLCRMVAVASHCIEWHIILRWI